MCMTVDKRYKGTSKRVIVAYKVFCTTDPLWYGPQRIGLSSLIRYYHFKRKAWNGPTKQPGFHAYKTRYRAAAYDWRRESTVVRRVLLKGIMGESKTHYTARYLWVN